KENSDSATMQELNEKLASMTISKSDCSKCAAPKMLNVNNLTKYQKKVYYNIQENDSGVITIDTPSGTGKTFLLCTLAKDHQKTIKFVIFRKDQANIYTIPSPTMLLLLYIISLQHKLHLIFAGNGMQLNAINKSQFHKENNFYIMQILNDLTINKLAENIRICDNMLESEVSCFHKRLLQIQPAGNIPFYYNLRYYLYTLFRSKYFTEERFDTIYIAQTHKNIKKRLNRLIDYCKLSGRSYYEEPFYYHNIKGILLPLPKNRKGVHHVVLLQNVFSSNFHIVSLEIRFIKDDHVEVIQRVQLNYYQILPAYRKWLMEKIKYTDELWQFPLRPYTLTYHAILGQTLKEEQVELNADCFYANFMYIGLSCIRHESDIHKIHDQDVAGYLVTEYMENVRNDTTYYYRCWLDTHTIYEYVTNKQPVKYIDDIEWTTVNDVKQFESMRNMTCSCYWRIKRTVYEKSNGKVDTPLMQVARFVKENPD
ncbi:unnamed protein product, partial [Heterotrigona itama]